MLIRHSPPGKYDHAPSGTMCAVLKRGEQFELFVQMSQNEEEPRWEQTEFVEEMPSTKQAIVDAIQNYKHK